jgi:hypothetical protein
VEKKWDQLRNWFVKQFCVPGPDWMKRMTKSFQKAITLDGMAHISLPFPIKLKLVLDSDADNTVLPGMLDANAGIHPHVTKIHRSLQRLSQELHARGTEWGEVLQEIQMMNEQLHHGMTTAVEKRSSGKYPALWVRGLILPLILVAFTLVVGLRG